MSGVPVLVVGGWFVAVTSPPPFFLLSLCRLSRQLNNTMTTPRQHVRHMNAQLWAAIGVRHSPRIYLAALAVGIVVDLRPGLGPAQSFYGVWLGRQGAPVDVGRKGVGM